MNARNRASRIGKTGRLFSRAEGGGVALIFALSLPVVSMMALASVDIHRASSVRMNLQDALDSATLAAARSGHTDDTGITEVGLANLRANMHALPNTGLIEDQVSFSVDAGGVVVATAKAKVDTIAASMFLGHDIDVAAKSEVMRANSRIELALVIDNTGSMRRDGKLRAAQDAASALVRRLADAAKSNPEPDAVRISIVPFSQTVRIGAQYQHASWMDGSAQAEGNDYMFQGGANRLALFSRMRTSWAGCVESRPYPYDTLDTAPAGNNRATKFVHYFAPDEPDVGSRWSPGAYSDWDRQYRVDNNYLDDGLAATRANQKWDLRSRRTQKYGNRVNFSGGRGPNRGCTIEPLTRLTTDYTALLRSIDNMVADGNTNIPMGLAWGWHTLSPNAPFGDGMPYGEPSLKKIAILMTDGENVNDVYPNPNRARYAGVGYIGEGRLGVGTASSGAQRRDAMDGRLAELCSNMQSQNITLYTVGVGVDSRTQTLLRNCASSPNNFFNVNGASGIADAFDSIAGSIDQLRISR